MLLVVAVVVGAFLLSVDRVVSRIEVQKHPLRSTLFTSLPQVEFEERLGYPVTTTNVRGVLKAREGRLTGEVHSALG